MVHPVCTVTLTHLVEHRHAAGWVPWQQITGYRRVLPRELDRTRLGERGLLLRGQILILLVPLGQGPLDPVVLRVCSVGAGGGADGVGGLGGCKWVVGAWVGWSAGRLMDG